MDWTQGTVVAVVGDVELADRNFYAFELGYELTEKTGQMHPTGVDADDDDGFRVPR